MSEKLEDLVNNDGYTLDESISFEFDGTSEGWTFNAGTGEFKNGFLVLLPNVNSPKADPYAVHSIPVNADDYRRMVVGVKYVSGIMSKQKPEMFFTTEAEPAWATPKCIVGKYVIPAGAKDGDMIAAVFDLKSNALFTGPLKMFRFDPYNAFDNCEIDYIRFYK